MKIARPKGYSLLELLVTLTILTALTGVSLIGFASPKALLDRESTLTLVANLLENAQLRSLFTGKTTTLSWTPYAWWMNEQKTLDFGTNSPWRWQNEIQSVQLQADGGLSVTDQNGQDSTLPQAVKLFYNQTQVAQLVIVPSENEIRFQRAHQD